jgi:4-amino-4-deoxy-L-arabinose transferase-like glycosyltransferase
MNLWLTRFSTWRIGICIGVVVFLFQGFIFWQVSALDAQRQTSDTEYMFPVVPSDSSDYARLADNLLSHGVFSTAVSEPRVPEIHWPIGYPGFLAITKYFSDSFVLASVIQMMLTSLTAVLIYVVSRRWLTASWSLVPALLYGFDPAVAYYSASIHSDALFTSLCFFVIVLFFFYTAARDSRWSVWWCLGLGACLGVVTLVRPISQFLGVGLPLLGIFLWWGQYSWRFFFSRVIVFGVGFVIVLTPWLMRNYELTGTVMLSDVGSKNLLLYNTRYFLIEQKLSQQAMADGVAQGGYADSAVARVVDEELKQQLDERAAAYGTEPYQHYAPLALSYILAEPFAYTKFHLINTLPYFFAGSVRHYSVSVLGPFRERAGEAVPPRLNLANYISTLLSQGSWENLGIAIKSLSVVLLEVTYRSLLLLFAVGALFLKGDNTRTKIMWIFGALILYFAILTGPVSFTRYRIVSEPYLLIMAAVGASAGVSFIRNRLRVWRGR